MTITEAFEEVLFKSKPSDCCMTNDQMKTLRYRYRSGAQIGHLTFLRLLECQGYLITVEKENSEKGIEKILSNVKK